MKERFVSPIVIIMLLCLVLGACSSAATTTTPTMSLTPTTTSLPTPTQTLQKALYRPTPYFSPTPNLHWNAETIEVSWNVYGSVSQPEWLSNTIAKLAVYADSSSEGQVTVDISAGPSAQAVAASVNSDWRIFSPQKTFVIECGGGMKMLRVSDNGLVSTTNLLPPLSPGVICSTYVRWAPDESMAAFVGTDFAVYLWRSNSTDPWKIMDHADGSFAWSPDSLELAAVKGRTGYSCIADVFDRLGNLLYEFPFEPGGDGPIVGWLTNGVIISYSRYSQKYYDVRTGQFLFDWTSSPLIFRLGQLNVSPNGRWIFIYPAGLEFENPADPNLPLAQKDYSLYDVQEKKRIPLPGHEGDFLGFAGWSSDSTKLYLISRPAVSTSISDPATPFGLLAYDVQTHKFELLFKDAVQVVWNTDQSWAFVVLAARDDQGNLGLAGGLWKPATDRLIGQWRVADQMVYQDTAYDGFFPAFPTPIPIAWSHDGQIVAVSDGFGRVNLLDENGPEKVLTEDMDANGVGLWWSPDDQHLLVEVKGQAWIVNTSIH